MLLLSEKKAEEMDQDLLFFRYQVLKAADTLLNRKLKVRENYPKSVVTDMRRLSVAISLELFVIHSVVIKQALRSRNGHVIKFPFTT